MKELNWAYVIAGILFGYLIYQNDNNLLLSSLLGLAVALGGNRGCIFQRNKKNID